MVYGLKVSINLFESYSILATDFKQRQNVAETIRRLFSAVTLTMTNGPAADSQSCQGQTVP